MAQAAEWQRAGLAMNLAVNISAEDIGDLSLRLPGRSLLCRHQLAPTLLTFRS